MIMGQLEVSHHLLIGIAILFLQICLSTSSTNVICQTGRSFKNGNLVRIDGGGSAELVCDPGFALETEEKFLLCHNGIVIDDPLVNCIGVTQQEGISNRVKRSTFSTHERKHKKQGKSRHQKVKICIENCCFEKRLFFLTNYHFHFRLGQILIRQTKVVPWKALQSNGDIMVRMFQV